MFLLSSQASLAVARAVLEIEPRTSHTLSENHATRPNSQLMWSASHTNKSGLHVVPWLPWSSPLCLCFSIFVRKSDLRRPKIFTGFWPKGPALFHSAKAPAFQRCLVFCVKSREYLLRSPGTQRCWVCSVQRRDTIPSLLKGTWCSGITSAPHAEGPGLNPQCVHVQEKRSPGTQRCWVFLVSRRDHLPSLLGSGKGCSGY